MYGYHIYNTDVYINNYLTTRAGFLRVGDKTYNTFDAAVEAIEEEGTIVLLNDEGVQETGTVPEGKNITFDLNGHTLTTTQPITNKGTFKVIDSSVENV